MGESLGVLLLVDRVDRQRRQAGNDKRQTDEDDGPGGPALRKLDAALPNAGAAGANGLPGLKSAEIVGDFLRRGVALLGVFLQTLQADGFEVARQLGLKAAG